LLDLVITDDNIIQKIEPLAPLGKSDHVVLMIETNVFSHGSSLEQKLNYNKGDQCRINANRGPWKLFARGPLLTRDKDLSEL